MSIKILYVDLETTGQYFWKHGVHQISGCIEIDGEIKEIFDFKVKPNERALIDNDALKVCNVTEKQIMSYPSSFDIYTKLVRLLAKYSNKFDKNDKYYLCGYNIAGFDVNFLKGFFIQNDDSYFFSWFWPHTLDVYVLASQYLINERIKLKDFKLKTVAQYLGIEIDESKLHDASYDIDLTRQIYKIVTK